MLSHIRWMILVGVTFLTWEAHIRHCSCFTPTQQWQRPGSSIRTRIKTRTASPLLDSKKNDLDKNLNSTLYTWDEIQSDPDLFDMERKQSREVFNSLLLPQQINKAVTAFAWAFLASGIILRVFGYDYVRTPEGWISIDTIEHRSFQMEVRNTPSSYAKSIDYSKRNTFSMDQLKQR